MERCSPLDARFGISRQRIEYLRQKIRLIVSASFELTNWVLFESLLAGSSEHTCCDLNITQRLSKHTISSSQLSKGSQAIYFKQCDFLLQRSQRVDCWRQFVPKI